MAKIVASMKTLIAHVVSKGYAAWWEDDRLIVTYPPCGLTWRLENAKVPCTKIADIEAWGDLFLAQCSDGARTQCAKQERIPLKGEADGSVQKPCSLKRETCQGCQHYRPHLVEVVIAERQG